VGSRLKKLKQLRWLRYKYLTFVRIKDNPYNIAVGAALGISFDILPTFGLGVIAAYFIASLVRVNRLAAVISAVVFKLAIPFFIFINLKTGQLFIKEDLIQANDDLIQANMELIPHSWLNFDWSHLGRSFLLGSVINAVVFYGVAYFLVYRFLNWRRSTKG